MTLRRFAAGLQTIPATAAWYLVDLGRSQGKQELFTRQSPERLRVLREHALIESAVSSNRIEGVSIPAARVLPVIMGRALLRDRDEEEVRGYRDALRLIHEHHADLPVSTGTILQLHRLSRGEIGDAGRFRAKSCDIIEHLPDGRQRVRFRAVAPADVPGSTAELLELWRTGLEERKVHPLVLMAGANLDFLCIHPFRDGNGRVSRLLLLLQCYHLGYEVGRYVSLERTIEQNKERYYETLELSSEGWHQDKHNPWHYINFVLYILKTAYLEFERRVGEIATPRGGKTELVIAAIDRHFGPFHVSDLQKECPSVSLDWIRALLKKLRADGRVECLGRGLNAQWQKTDRWDMGTKSGI
jgi:Fic family protein